MTTHPSRSTTTDVATRNLELATALLDDCFGPPRPERYARFVAGDRAQHVFAAFATAFPDARFEVTWVVADERRVAVGGRTVATHAGRWRDVAATGRTIDVACTMTLTFEEGAVVDVESVIDTLTMAEQIGAVASLGPRSCERLGTAGGGR